MGILLSGLVRKPSGGLRLTVINQENPSPTRSGGTKHQPRHDDGIWCFKPYPIIGPEAHVYWLEFDVAHLRTVL